MFYYEVELGVKRHWDEASFTYNNKQRLDVGSVVVVPFGSQKKAGIIKAQVEKPVFNTKEILDFYDLKLPEQTRNFKAWYEKYYATQGGQATAQFIPSYISKTKKVIQQIKPTRGIKNYPVLNARQIQAKNEITKNNKGKVLHGSTGSGKTRIYASLIMEELDKGNNCLLLYPEIALTPQITQELEKFAPVLVFHSKITNTQRSELWQKIAKSETPYIVIGARSALFLPHKNLGLVILDEAHDSSYKQSSDIRYNGILVAGGLSKVHGARLLLGSATPPVAETELILESGGEIICLHKQAIKNNKTKKITVIDKKNREKFKKYPLLSDELISLIDNSLKQKKQSLLFINRRGTAKLVLCESCGWQAECLKCDLPTTFHHDIHKQVCHTCGNIMKVEMVCPDCSGELKQKSFGSKAIVSDVQRLFPQARIGRFDGDNTKLDSFAEMYEQIKKGDIDILIGTQQIVKGLDLPKLATVGVIDADLSLHFPDYSSEERTFQLISQVAGRVGRGHTNGEIIVQTYQPNNHIIQLSMIEDWHGFRERELKNRRKHLLPPYTYLAKIIFRDKSKKLATKKATQVKSLFEPSKKIHIDGPLPSFTAKRSGYYYIQLHLRSSSRAELLKLVTKLPREAIFELDPVSLL